MNKRLKCEYYIHCYEKNIIEENTALFVSGHGKEASGYIHGMLMELIGGGYGISRIYFCCADMEGYGRHTVPEMDGVGNVKAVRYNGRKYLYLLSSVKYIVTDIPLGEWFIKKAGQVIVNAWYHNPLNKTVKSAADCIYEYGCIQKNIAFADYIIAPDGFSVNELAETYGAKNLSSGKILCTDLDMPLVSVCERVFLGKEGCTCSTLRDNDRENVVIYVSELQLNGLTSALINVLNNLDLEKRNYFAVVLTEEIGGCTERLQKLPRGVSVIPISVRALTRFYEYVALKLYYKLNINNRLVKGIVDKIYEREAERYFGGFVYSHVIQYIGYQRDVINLFGKMCGVRSIFVHNDMVQELKLKNNQHELTLRAAYAHYDYVAAVSKDIYPTLFELGATKDNAVIVNNCIDYKGILEKGFGDIEFQESTVSNVSVGRLKEILAGSAVKFINIARFSPEKGQVMLIDAFEQYHNNDSDSFLIIIGGYGDSYDNIREHAEGMESRENIILIKSIQNPMPILKQCDLFILSSVYEGLGLVILEAVIQGVPVMSTNVVGPQGFMRDYGGYLVNADTDGIYNGMCEFARNGIEPLCVDFEEYNKKAVEEFESILT